MPFCSNCGQEVHENQAVCLNCGVSVGSKGNAVDKGGFGWGLLGFCIPIVGLVLYLVWKDDRPKSAKSAGIGALISLITIVVFYILMFVLAIASSSMY